MVRSGLGVDTTRNDVNVEQFAYHLLTEFEQLALTEKRPGASSVISRKGSLEVERSKAKKGEEETGRSPTKREGKEEKPKCRRRRCWNCGSPDHMSPACTRPKGTNHNYPQKARLQKVEGEEKSPSSSRGKEEEGGTEQASKKDLLEQANKMLKV